MAESAASRDRARRLATSSIPRLLVEFSAPAIVGMVAQASYNMIDRAFVGQAVGTLGIAAVSVTVPCVFISLACAMLVGFGGTTLISIRLGEQRVSDAERILGNMLTLLLLVALLVTTLTLLLLDPILEVFGASKTVLPYARDYLRIIACGTVFQIVGFGLNAAIRGEGNPRVAMCSMLIGVMVNAILAPVFIFGFSWGMKGAAWATVCGEAVSAVWVVCYFVSDRSLLKLRLRYLPVVPGVCRQVLAVGAPPFLMQCVASVLQCLLNHQLRVYGGDLAIAVMGIVYSTLLMFAMPIIGLNHGTQPIIGYNYGACHYTRVKKTLKAAILLATAVITFGFAIIMLLPAQVVSLFGRDDPVLIAVGSRALRIALLMMPVVGFQIVGSGYFQAVGKPKMAALLMLSRQMLILIPAVLILPLFFGLDGIWAAMPASDCAASLLTGACLLVEMRHLKGRTAHDAHQILDSHTRSVEHLRQGMPVIVRLRTKNGDGSPCETVQLPSESRKGS